MNLIYPGYRNTSERAVPISLGQGLNINLESMPAPSLTRAPYEVDRVPTNMSPAGRAVLADLEGGLQLEAYDDGSGYMTIGVGHAHTLNGKPIKSGMTITPEEGEALFREDLQKYEAAVREKLGSRLSQINQNQFDALVSATFNLGTKTPLLDSVVTAIDDGKLANVPSIFEKYVNANGRYVQGLANRRMAEVALWNSNPDTPTNITGPEVASIQEQLNSLGFLGADGQPLDVDGLLGPNTANAIREMQAQAGIPVTGAIDPATQQVVASSVATAPVQPDVPGVATLTADQVAPNPVQDPGFIERFASIFSSPETPAPQPLPATPAPLPAVPTGAVTSADLAPLPVTPQPIPMGVAPPMNGIAAPVQTAFAPFTPSPNLADLPAAQAIEGIRVGSPTLTPAAIAKPTQVTSPPITQRAIPAGPLPAATSPSLPVANSPATTPVIGGQPVEEFGPPIPDPSFWTPGGAMPETPATRINTAQSFNDPTKPIGNLGLAAMERAQQERMAQAPIPMGIGVESALGGIGPQPAALPDPVYGGLTSEPFVRPFSLPAAQSISPSIAARPLSPTVAAQPIQVGITASTTPLPRAAAGPVQDVPPSTAPAGPFPARPEAPVGGFPVAEAPGLVDVFGPLLTQSAPAPRSPLDTAPPNTGISLPTGAPPAVSPHRVGQAFPTNPTSPTWINGGTPTNPAFSDIPVVEAPQTATTTTTHENVVKAPAPQPVTPITVPTGPIQMGAPPPAIAAPLGPKPNFGLRAPVGTQDFISGAVGGLLGGPVGAIMAPLGQRMVGSFFNAIGNPIQRMMGGITMGGSGMGPGFGSGYGISRLGDGLYGSPGGRAINVGGDLGAIDAYEREALRQAGQESLLDSGLHDPRTISSGGWGTTGGLW